MYPASLQTPINQNLVFIHLFNKYRWINTAIIKVTASSRNCRQPYSSQLSDKKRKWKVPNIHQLCTKKTATNLLKSKNLKRWNSGKLYQDMKACENWTKNHKFLLLIKRISHHH